MPQSVTPLLHFELNGSRIEYIQEFNFLGLALYSSLSFKLHLTKIGNIISRVIRTQNSELRTQNYIQHNITM